MPDLFDRARSEPMTLEEYSADFRRRRRDPNGAGEAWKLERRQFFSDPDDPPWVAFSRGRWHESLRLMEGTRSTYREYYEETRAQGVTHYRVRVVEEPVQPYVQWEFHYLMIPAGAGERIRVLRSDRVEEHERDGPLPEIIATGTGAVYEVLYSPDGRPTGARRTTDAESGRRCAELVKALYAAGEDLETYFEREIEHLDPPRLEAR
ncbi:DUF6879 family protein [Saccharothrix lopnurensis]|uniref:DUF6879 family protein n=1 Tax=Saccharothrix lopnurensis TaxID=1670621 RepID=A0ABW1PBA2_9PSEU